MNTNCAAAFPREDRPYGMNRLVSTVRVTNSPILVKHSIWLNDGTHTVTIIYKTNLILNIGFILYAGFTTMKHGDGNHVHLTLRSASL